MSESLWGSIQMALEKSASFVLMASPGAARSPWADREVRFWREHRERSTFSVVLTDGEVAWSDEDCDYDWAQTTALPPAMSGWYDEVPGWSDAR